MVETVTKLIIIRILIRFETNMFINGKLPYLSRLDTTKKTVKVSEDLKTTGRTNGSIEH